MHIITVHYFIIDEQDKCYKFGYRIVNLTVQILYTSGALPSTKWNEINRVLGPFCEHIGQTGPG